MIGSRNGDACTLYASVFVSWNRSVMVIKHRRHDNRMMCVQCEGLTASFIYYLLRVSALLSLGTRLSGFSTIVSGDNREEAMAQKRRGGAISLHDLLVWRCSVELSLLTPFVFQEEVHLPRARGAKVKRSSSLERHERLLQLFHLL